MFSFQRLELEGFEVAVQLVIFWDHSVILMTPSGSGASFAWKTSPLLRALMRFWVAFMAWRGTDS